MSSPVASKLPHAPHAGVAEGAVVEIHRLLGGHHHDDTEGARLLRQRDEGTLGGRVLGGAGESRRPRRTPRARVGRPSASALVRKAKAFRTAPSGRRCRIQGGRLRVSASRSVFARRELRIDGMFWRCRLPAFLQAPFRNFALIETATPSARIPGRPHRASETGALDLQRIALRCAPALSSRTGARLRPSTG